MGCYAESGMSGIFLSLLSSLRSCCFHQLNYGSVFDVVMHSNKQTGI